MPARVFITGASGFAGRHLVDRLLDDGHDISIFVRAGFELPARWRGKLKTVELADWRPDRILACFEGLQFDIVYHLAAYGVTPGAADPVALRESNIELPMMMANLCEVWGASLVATGSCSEYAPGPAGHLLQESDLLIAEGATPSYASTKALGGRLLIQRCAEYNVPLRYLRLFNVYGPNEAPHRLLPSLVKKLHSHTRVPLSEGLQTRDFIHITDVIEALIAAGADASRVKSIDVLNVCTGTGTNVRAFARIVAEVLGADPALLGFGDLPLRQGEISWQVGSPSAMAGKTGWMARFDVKAGIVACLKRLRLI